MTWQEEYQGKMIARFTSRYNVCKLVLYKVFQDVNAAIAREKQIKAGSKK